MGPFATRVGDLRLMCYVPPPLGTSSLVLRQTQRVNNTAQRPTDGNSGESDGDEIMVVTTTTAQTKYGSDMACGPWLGGQGIGNGYYEPTARARGFK